MLTVVKTQRVGRPSKYNQRTVKKLEEAFNIGATVDEACAVAKITKPTFYDWVRSLPDFHTRMQQAQAYSDLFAKKVVNRAIVEDNDLNTSKWWLEKRQYNNKDIIGIETNDGDKTTRFIITRGNPVGNEPIASKDDPLPTTSSTQIDGETL